MAHFAKLENNIVTWVIVIPDEEEHRGQEYINQELNLEGEWIQTSYNHRIRKNYAGIGFTYDIQRDAFIPPKPFNSWLLNETTCRWEAPIPLPSDDKPYSWNEDTLSWDEVIIDGN